MLTRFLFGPLPVAQICPAATSYSGALLHLYHQPLQLNRHGRALVRSEQSAPQARESPVDYLAVGPVFATQSKQVPDPVVGLERVRAARRLTRKPLVAIGGITRSNCAIVIDAGADSVAVISDLIPRGGESVAAIVGKFLFLLSAAGSGAHSG